MPSSQQVVHSNRAHSILGASGGERWTNCPGSVFASSDAPQVESSFAKEGTAAHEMVEMCLSNGQDAIEWIGRSINGFEVDEDWADALQLYLDTCRKYTGPGWTFWIERRITLAPLNPPIDMFGTADFCAYHADMHLLVVVDLKFGRGVPVKAEGNIQERYYALGVLLDLPHTMPVDRVLCTIVQPRIPFGQKVQSEEVDPIDLLLWADWLIERARATQEPDAPLKAGEWCRFCPITGRCKEQSRSAFSYAQDEFGDLVVEGSGELRIPEARTLTSEQFARALNMIPRFREFANAIEETAIDGITRGWLTVPGWKAVEKESRPAWIGADDEAAVASRLKASHGLSDDDIWRKKLAPPAQARAALKAILRLNGMKAGEAEEEAKRLLEPLTHRKSSGYKLVPEAIPLESVGVRGSEFPLLDA